MHYLLLIVGILCAGLGGELFIRGTVGISRWLRISAGIVAVTVAAFATSSPELSVGISAALAGTPHISFGDALGSNVLNVALILGVTLMFGKMRSTLAEVQRDYVVALLAPAILWVLALDGRISRLDGAILLLVFAVWITAVTLHARKQQLAAEALPTERRHGLALVYCVLGLALLIAAGRLIVSGARGVAEQFGLAEFVIGAVIVAVGTSVPELATAIIAKLRGHDEIGLGTILGSNIFNGLFIIGVVAVISPFEVNAGILATTLILGLVTVALTFPRRDVIERWRGVVLLALYVLYVVLALKHG